MVIFFLKNMKFKMDCQDLGFQRIPFLRCQARFSRFSLNITNFILRIFPNIFYFQFM